MGGAFSSCCCDVETGCTLRVLDALKTRHGFPPLWITEVVTGSTKKSKLRFLEKRIFYHIVEYYRIPTLEWPDPETLPFTLVQDTTYEVIITIDRLTGKVDYTETGSSARTAAANAINSTFSAKKGTSGNSDTFTPGGSGGPDGWQTVAEWTSVLDGVDQTSFRYHSYAEFFDYYTYSGHVPSGVLALSRKVTTDIAVELANEYEDEVFKADIDDLLTSHNTGIGDGLDGVENNTIALIRWNENGVNSALGYPSATNGACWIDVTTLSDYATPTDPEVVLYTMSAFTYSLTFSGAWWQNQINPALQVCHFEDAASIPGFFNVTDERAEVQALKKVRFFVSDPVCSTYRRVDGAGTVTFRCQVDASSGGHVDVKEPYFIAISNSNIERTLDSGGVMFLYTCPGALTGGDCPCSLAP